MKKVIIQHSRPSISFIVFTGILLALVIASPGFSFIIKLALSLALVYWIDNSVMKLIENDIFLIICKGYLFKRIEKISIELIKKATFTLFNNKGGTGYKLEIETENKKFNFVKTMPFDKVDIDIKLLEDFFANKHIPFKENDA